MRKLVFAAGSYLAVIVFGVTCHAQSISQSDALSYPGTETLESSQTPNDAAKAVSDNPSKKSAPPETGIGLVDISITQGISYESYLQKVARTTDFSELRDIRSELAADIEAARHEREEASRNLFDRGLRGYTIDDVLSMLDKNLSRLEQAKTCSADPSCEDAIGQDVPYYTSEIDLWEKHLAFFREYQEKMRVAAQKIRDLEVLFDQLDRKIGDALARDIAAQDFKTKISQYFTGIVAIMIVLFFGLLFYDEKVRNSLFSTPSAIQFITLFSLVIAIILFGITGILHDKELSALLGGLSGYILGRYSSEGVNVPAPSPPPPGPPPPPAPAG